MLTRIPASKRAVAISFGVVRGCSPALPFLHPSSHLRGCPTTAAAAALTDGGSRRFQSSSSSSHGNDNSPDVSSSDKVSSNEPSSTTTTPFDAALELHRVDLAHGSFFALHRPLLGIANGPMFTAPNNHMINDEEYEVDPVFDLTNLFATLQPHSPPPTPVTQLPALSTPTATAWASLPPAMNDPDQAVQDFFMQLEMKETLVDKSQDQASSSSSSSSSTSSPSSPSQSSLPASTITASTAHDPSVGVSVSSIMDELFSRTITADKHAQMQIMGPTMDEDMMSDDKMDHGLYMTSVLRKRKIKMRKHKYKKLRKRTRALRKKLGK